MTRLLIFADIAAWLSVAVLAAALLINGWANRKLTHNQILLYGAQTPSSTFSLGVAGIVWLIAKWVQ